MSAPVTLVPQKDSWSQVARNMGLLDLGNILTYCRPPDPIRSLAREEEANIEDGYQKMDESVLIALPEFGKLKNLDAVQTCILAMSPKHMALDPYPFYQPMLRLH
jgi:hypothetical protein